MDAERIKAIIEASVAYRGDDETGDRVRASLEGLSEDEVKGLAGDLVVTAIIISMRGLIIDGGEPDMVA